MKKLTLGKVVDVFANYYNIAKESDYIRKPLSWSLYHTWRWTDSVEQSREIKGEDR